MTTQHGHHETGTPPYQAHMHPTAPASDVYSAVEFEAMKRTVHSLQLDVALIKQRMNAPLITPKNALIGTGIVIGVGTGVWAIGKGLDWMFPGEKASGRGR